MRLDYNSIYHQTSYLSRTNAIKKYLESKINKEYVNGYDVILFEINESWLSEHIENGNESYMVRIEELIGYIKKRKFKYTFWKFGREDEDISNIDFTSVKGIFVYVGFSGG